MGFESCAYVATENVGVAFAHRARNACLLVLFAGFLAAGVLLVSLFPNDGCAPAALSEQAVGLGALLLVAACCACTQGLCYVFDERERVARTSTQEHGDVPSKHAPRGAEVYAAIDIGEKSCSTISSCWQVCVFLSCFGIGISLLSLLQQAGGAGGAGGADSGTVSDTTSSTPAAGDDGNNNDSNSSNSSSTGSGVVVDGVCPNDLLLVFGVVIIVLPIVFCLTMVWRLWRSPSPLKHFDGTPYSINLMGSMRGGGGVGDSGGSSGGAMVSAGGGDAAAPRDVELAVS